MPLPLPFAFGFTMSREHDNAWGTESPLVSPARAERIPRGPGGDSTPQRQGARLFKLVLSLDFERIPAKVS